MPVRSRNRGTRGCRMDSLSSADLIYCEKQRERCRDNASSVRVALRLAANLLTCLIKECETRAVHVRETLI